MLIDLKHGLKAGDKLSLTLRFERAGTRKVTAEVRGL
jgi:copper(I)-binding protein